MSGELNMTNSDKPERVLMVIANPAISTTLGIPVGFWEAELTHAYREFTEVGYRVTVASPDIRTLRLRRLRQHFIMVRQRSTMSRFPTTPP